MTASMSLQTTICFLARRRTLEKPAGIAHRETESHRLLAHQIRNRVIPEHTTCERKSSGCNTDIFGCFHRAIGRKEIRGSDEREGHLDSDC